MYHFLKTSNNSPDGRDVALIETMTGRVIAKGTEAGNLGDVRPTLLREAGLSWQDIGPAPVAAPQNRPDQRPRARR